MQRQVFMIGLVLAGTIGISTSAIAIPVPNQQGDYPIPALRQRGGRHVNWQVVDPDPQGLNCRMAKQFQGFSVDGANAPQELFQRNRHTISQWAVVTKFNRGQRLRAVTGNLANQIMLVDRQGKPWLPVNSPKGDCFVRANSRFIQPLREDPTTLKPLE